MNKINEYLENLDKKNLIMLYLSILILFFIIVYFVYENMILPKKMRLIDNKISIIKKIRLLNNNESKLILLKKKYKKEKIKLNSLKEDLKFLNAVVYSSKRLNVNKYKYLNIINKYLQMGSNLNASFVFNRLNALNKYNISVYGNFSPDDYFIFVKFLKILQQPNAIITINDMKLNYKKNVHYDINLSIWSIK